MLLWTAGVKVRHRVVTQSQLCAGASCPELEDVHACNGMHVQSIGLFMVSLRCSKSCGTGVKASAVLSKPRSMGGNRVAYLTATTVQRTVLPHQLRHVGLGRMAIGMRCLVRWWHQQRFGISLCQRAVVAWRAPQA